MRRTDLHYPKPKAVSVTQSTEVGTTYSLKELQLIGETCRKRDLKFHMDGARFANAVVESGLDPSEIITESGVDILCLVRPKMVRWWEMRLSSLTVHWRMNLNTDVNRRVSWLRK